MAGESAKVSFKRGLLKDLPTSAVDGTIYMTTDEGGIYLGVGTTMKRLGDYVVVSNIASLPSKADQNALYYATAENVLARWNGSKWIQVNAAGLTQVSVSGSGNAITSAEVKVNSTTGAKVLTLTKGTSFATSGQMTDVQNKASANETAIGTLSSKVDTAFGEDFTSKTIGATITDAINEVKGTGTLQTGYSTISDLGTKIRGVETAVGNASSGMTKKITDLENASSDHETRITNNTTAIGTNTSAIATNTSAIATLNGTGENSVSGKVNAAKTELNTAISALSTRTTTAENNITSLDGRLDTAETKIGTLETEIQGLSGAMHFKGVLSALPTNTSSYNDGDVIIVGEKEYVFKNKGKSGAGFEEFGDATRIGAVETRATTLENVVGKTANAGLQKKATDNANAAAAAKTAADNAQAAADAASSKIDTQITNIKNGASTGYDTLKGTEEKIKAAQTKADENARAITDLQNSASTTISALTWGSF